MLGNVQADFLTRCSPVGRGCCLRRSSLDPLLYSVTVCVSTELPNRKRALQGTDIAQYRGEPETAGTTVSRHSKGRGGGTRFERRGRDRSLRKQGLNVFFLDCSLTLGDADQHYLALVL